MRRTSEALRAGEVYSRDDLRRMFAIVDATINNGVFHPKGHDSLWLFVTETKTSDRTQYSDKLEGDILQADGQTSGRTDRMIVEHDANGLELVLFYRKHKSEFPHGGFRYEGVFRYRSQSGNNPKHFTFERVDAVLATVEHDIEALRVEETYHEGAATKALVNRYERDPKLRAAAIRLHGLQCQACGFSFASTYGARGKDFIEVHHLTPVSGYGRSVDVDPAKDMAVVCSNCHRMIHRDARTPLSLDDLRLLLASRPT